MQTLLRYGGLTATLTGCISAWMHIVDGRGDTTGLALIVTGLLMTYAGNDDED